MNGNKAVPHQQGARVNSQYDGRFFHLIPVGLRKFGTLNKSTKIIFNYVIGLSLFLWLAYSIIHQVRHQENLQMTVAGLRGALQGSRLAGLIAVFLLMFVNWGIEAYKWKVLVKPLEVISFRKAFYAILSGVSLSVNTPNRIGEYGGRILYLRNANKLRGIAVTAVGSFSQFIVTIMFGILGLVYFLAHFGPLGNNGNTYPGIWEKSLLVLLVVIDGITVFLYFRLEIIVSLFSRVKILRRMRSLVRVISRFSAAELKNLLILSVIRYLVFSAQYLILLQVVGVEMHWWQGFAMICLIYLVLALVPTIAIAELGIRGQVGLFFLGLLSGNKIGIITATIGIWFINLILPAILGSLLLLGIKVFSDK